jgi:hypothetical protein
MAAMVVGFCNFWCDRQPPAAACLSRAMRFLHAWNALPAEVKRPVWGHTAGQSLGSRCAARSIHWTSEW